MKKILSVLLCVSMIFSMSSFALATETVVETDQDIVVEEAVCTCGVADGEAHLEACALYVAPEASEAAACEECGLADGHAETCSKYVAPETPAEPEVPAEPETPVCTCEAAEGETHAEDCALYVAPEVPAAIVCEVCGVAEGELHL